MTPLGKMGNSGPIWSQNYAILYLWIRSKDFFQILKADWCLYVDKNNIKEINQNMSPFG